MVSDYVSVYFPSMIHITWSLSQLAFPSSLHPSLCPAIATVQVEIWYPLISGKKNVCLLPLPSFLLWLVIILQRVSKRQVDCCHPRQHAQELVLSYHLQHLILFFLLTSKKETPLIIQQSIPSDFRSLLPSTCAHHFNNGVHYFTLESLITLWITINLFNHCFFSLHSP